MHFYSQSGQQYEYPEWMLDGRGALEGKFLACLAQDITLFQDIPETITSENFIADESKSYFHVYKTLYENNYKQIDSIAIESEFPHGTTQRELFESFWGSEKTKKFRAEKQVSIENFDKFKVEFLESNAKMELYRTSVNNVEMLRDNDLSSEPSESVYGVLDYNLVNATENFSTSNDTFQLRVTNEFIKRCMAGDALGISYNLPTFTKKTLGMHLGNVSMMAAPTNAGKSSVGFAEYVMSIVGEKEKLFVYSNETSEDDLMTMLLVYVCVRQFKYTKLNKSRIKTWDKITPEEENIIVVAQAWIDENVEPYLTVKVPRTHNTKEFISCLRRYAYRGYKYFWFDTMKADDRGDVNVTGKLIDQSIRIYETCKKLHIHCWISFQIASYHKANFVRFLTDAHLGTAKGVAEILDILICMRDIYPDEFDGCKYDIKPFRYEKSIDGAWHRDYLKLDKEKHYVILTMAKNRYGEKDFAMVYEKLGHYGIFHEVGFCEVAM